MSERASARACSVQVAWRLRSAEAEAAFFAAMEAAGFEAVNVAPDVLLRALTERFPDDEDGRDPRLRLSLLRAPPLPPASSADGASRIEGAAEWLGAAAAWFS